MSRLKWTFLAGVVMAAAGAIALSNGSGAELDSGQKAPDFKLEDQNGKKHTLADNRGKWVVLAFYPKDMTPGCTLQANSLQVKKNEIAAKNATLYGISVQDTKSKKEFCEKERLDYSLLSDVQKTTARDYGVLGPAGMAKRVTYIVGPDGNIAARMDSVDVKNHGDEVLVKLASLQTADTGYRRRTSDITTLKPGDKAPGFDLKAVIPAGHPGAAQDGKIALTELLKNNKAVAVIWISARCPVSIDYEERMAKLAAANKGKSIAFVGIASNNNETAEFVIEHFKGRLGFPVLHDPGNVVADAYGAMVTPHVFLVDNKGVIRYEGAIDDEQDIANVKENYLSSAVEKLLAGTEIKPAKTKAFGCSIKRDRKAAPGA